MRIFTINILPKATTSWRTERTIVAPPPECIS